jgi:hypothetical protein
MAKRITLGKQALNELGIKFIVANVPLFPIGVDKVYRMKMINFDSLDEVKDKLGSIKNLIIFDEPAVYGEKFNKDIDGEEDKYSVRCIIDLTDKDLNIIKANLKETITQIFSFEWDFANFE